MFFHSKTNKVWGVSGFLKGSLMKIQADCVIGTFFFAGGFDDGTGVSMCLLCGYRRWLSPGNTGRHSFGAAGSTGVFCAVGKGWGGRF